MGALERQPSQRVFQATREIVSLTGLRGLAALYVVSYHHRIGVAFSNPVTTLLAHGYLAVDLFFVLSGFVMALTYCHLFQGGFTNEAFGGFLGRRIARIYPLYCTATVVGFLLVLAGCLQAPQPLPLSSSFILNLLMVQAWGLVGSFDGPGWSVSAEWAAYLLFPAFVILILDGNALARWFTGFACVGILVALCVLPDSVVHHSNPQKLLDLYGPNLALPVLRCLSEFVLGLLAYRIFRTPLGAKVGAKRWFGTAVCLLLLTLIALPWTDLAVVLLYPVLILSIASGSSLPARILSSPPARLAGTLSYSIYLTHELVSAVVKWAMSSMTDVGLPNHSGIGTPLGTSIVTLLVTFPVAYAAYMVIELPMRRRLRQFFEPTMKERATAAS